MLPKAGLLCKGSTVAPLKALSKWLCCLASCSRVSSRRILWLRSTCRAFCQCLLWFWAKDRKSLHAWRNRKASKRLGKRVNCNRVHVSVFNPLTYIYHCIRGYFEHCCSLCNLSDLLPCICSDTNTLQFRQRPVCGGKQEKEEISGQSYKINLVLDIWFVFCK